MFLKLRSDKNNVYFKTNYNFIMIIYKKKNLKYSNFRHKFFFFQKSETYIININKISCMKIHTERNRNISSLLYEKI